MKPDEISSARRAGGLSQERLAELLQVDALTVYRWEAGVSAPGAMQMALLEDTLCRYDGFEHPNMKCLIERPEAVALLDRQGIYRRVNTRFAKIVGIDGARLLGRYAPSCMDLWHRQVLPRTGRTPEKLALSDISEVTVIASPGGSPASDLLRHRINVVRHKQYSVVIVHRVESHLLGHMPTHTVVVVQRF